MIPVGGGGERAGQAGVTHQLAQLVVGDALVAEPVIGIVGRGRRGIVPGGAGDDRIALGGGAVAQVGDHQDGRRGGDHGGQAETDRAVASARGHAGPRADDHAAAEAGPGLGGGGGGADPARRQLEPGAVGAARQVRAAQNSSATRFMPSRSGVTSMTSAAR